MPLEDPQKQDQISPRPIPRGPAVVRDKGFTVLADPEHPTIDIVFVHGLQGHPRKTWTYNGDTSVQRGGQGTEPRSSGRNLLTTFFHRSRSRSPGEGVVATLETKTVPAEEDDGSVFWPRDYLPTDFPGARIMTYGYGSKVSEFFHGRTNNNSMYQHAKNLLESLDNERSKCPQRPLVFVAHSLGGIIVKDVLRRSKRAKHTPELLRIYESTIALIFMGTPHRGSNVADMGLLLQRIVKLMQFETNPRLLQTLQIDSTELDDLREEFSIMLADKAFLGLFTFQEGKRVYFPTGLTKIVEDVSSALDDALEQKFIIEDADHVGMCRFHSREDPGYEKLCRFLELSLSRLHEKQVILEKPQQEEFESLVKECLQSLAVLDDRFPNIPSPHHLTGQWIFEHPKFRSWVDTNASNLLLLSGKPGCGKSVLAKSVQQWLCQSHDSQAAYFFFNGRGAQIAQTMLGMARALLHQIFRDRRWLIKHVPLLDALAKLDRINGDQPKWTQSVVLDLLRAIPRVEVPGPDLYLVIDSLDEARREDTEEICDLLKELVKAAKHFKIKILLTSRVLPLSHEFDLSVHPAIILERQPDAEHIDRDIDCYIADKVSSKLRKYSEHFGPITETLKLRSNGVFLWVNLVMDRLVEKAREYPMIWELEEIVERTPSGSEIDKLYQNILDRQTKGQVRQRSTMLLWILFAKRPLGLREFQMAVTMMLRPDRAMDEAQVEKQISPADFKLRIESHCGGLVEIVESGSLVQLVHQTAKEYLMNNPERWLGSITEEQLHVQGHLELGRTCLTYLMLPALSNEPLKSLEGFTTGGPQAQKYDYLFAQHWLLAYAALHWMDHVDASSDVADALATLSREYVEKHAQNFFDSKYHSREQTTYFWRSEPLPLLCAKGRAHLVKAVLDAGANVNAETELGYTCLSCAADRGQLEVLRVLVGRGARAGRGGLGSRNTLLDAVAAGNVELVRLLLEHGAHHERARYHVHESFQAAYLEDKDEIVRAFLGKGVGHTELNLIGRKQQNGSEGDDIRLVKALSGYGVDLDLRDDDNCTALVRSARDGHRQLLRTLIRLGANVNLKGGDGRTALSWAAGNGDDAAVDVLMRSGADTTVCDSFGRSAVDWAEIMGQGSSVKLLGLQPSRKAPLPGASPSRSARPSHQELERIRELAMQEAPPSHLPGSEEWL